MQYWKWGDDLLFSKNIRIFTKHKKNESIHILFLFCVRSSHKNWMQWEIHNTTSSSCVCFPFANETFIHSFCHIFTVFQRMCNELVSVQANCNSPLYVPFWCIGSPMPNKSILISFTMKNLKKKRETNENIDVIVRMDNYSHQYRDGNANINLIRKFELRSGCCFRWKSNHTRRSWRETKITHVL